MSDVVRGLHDVDEDFFKKSFYEQQQQQKQQEGAAACSQRNAIKRVGTTRGRKES
jgi:hypothetical protein